MNSMIIETPNLQLLKQHYQDSGLVLMGWISWFYFWRPVFNFMLWGGMIWFLHSKLFLLNFTNIFNEYLVIILIIGVIMAFWLLYIHLQSRYKSDEKTLTANHQKIANDFGVTIQTLRTLQTAERMIIHLDDKGCIQQVEVS
jgi:poly-beta-1,6-N-acetyl-D-glucosamine biosynthesis protein PgaD